jgi:hypothetical protein
MNIDNRIKAFVSLGNFLKQFTKGQTKQQDNALDATLYNDLDELINTVHIYNPWFTEENVRAALGALAISLEEATLLDWVSNYIQELSKAKPAKRVAVIMAGNIPMVGFNDMFCILISGNKFVGKLSSDDKLLLPFIAKVLIGIEPQFKEYIEFTETKLENIEAVIATGSNNSARYFEYYFGKYPNIIRKNRNSVAVLTANESVDELKLLGEDIFKYFGLGCRNVSKLFVPKGYKFDGFYEAIFDFQHVMSNNKYMNNYEYNKTVYLMGNTPSLLDNNFLLLKEDQSLSSPIGVLFYEYYDDINSLNARLNDLQDEIQCIVSSKDLIKDSVSFGMSQCPRLTDYADGIDTMKFLLQ